MVSRPGYAETCARQLLSLCSLSDWDEQLRGPRNIREKIRLAQTVGILSPRLGESYTNPGFESIHPSTGSKLNGRQSTAAHLSGLAETTSSKAGAARFPGSGVEIQSEFVGMRPQAGLAHFAIIFVIKPGLDQVFGEYITLEQELMIVLEIFQRCFE